MNDTESESERDAPVPDEVRLLIVDDEADFRESAWRYFRKLGYQVERAEDGEEAINLARSHRFDVVILDLHMPGMSGIRVLEELARLDPAPKTIMLTGGGTIAHAVESLKKGAYDFLTKPIRLEDLARLIDRACGAARLEKENRQLREALRRHLPRTDLIGQSASMQEVYRLIQRTANSSRHVLIQGESGTGKELVARAIHQASPLAAMPLVVINCAALAESLLESELFGHEKGAFTGAVTAKPGLFEIADGGTLFIDEFGEMSGGLQVKLLRVLEDGSMRRVGSVHERRVKVRVIAATNADLEREVREKRFREDLYYRINVLGIRVPPLREREGDIPILARHLAGPDWEFEAGVLDRLSAYSWPGNVRQLQNAIERAKVLADENRIELRNLPEAIIHPVWENQIPMSPASNPDLETVNRMHIEEVFRRCNGNKTRTAKALGINRRSLYRLLEKYDLGTERR